MLTKMTDADWITVLRVFQTATLRGNGEYVRQSHIDPTSKASPPSFQKFSTRAALQTVGKLKRFKRIALRCEKTARNYGSFVALACAFIWIKSVHTA